MLVALAVVVGLIGIVLPVLPGLLLVWGAVVVWAVVGQVWWLAGLVTVAYAAGLALQYLLPGRRLRAGGVPTRSLVLGVLVGVVGFFVVPVVGAVGGFVLGVYLSELQRLRGHGAAWPSTVHALRAVGLSMLIELAAGLVIGAAWVGTLLWG
ncbi:membrane protein [Arsenicicoccus sp. oral taxon 190]|nr:membrane protein [Arsenicicoccus sp. oral taxon 190]